MVMVPALVRLLASESVSSEPTSMLWPASSGPPWTVRLELAEKEAAPPPARTRVEGVSPLPEPPAWTNVPTSSPPEADCVIEPPLALTKYQLGSYRVPLRSIDPVF